MTPNNSLTAAILLPVGQLVLIIGGLQTSTLWAFLVAQMVKNLPAVLETWVQSLGWEDPLEEGMAIHSSIFAMDGGAWWATVHRVAKSRTRLGN